MVRVPDVSQFVVTLIGNNSIRCLTPERIRSAFDSSTLGSRSGGTTETSYSTMNVAVNQLTVDLLLCFVHALDDTGPAENSQGTVDHCETDNFDKVEVDALQRHLRIFLPIPNFASHVFLLYTLRDNRRTLSAAWPPYTVWPAECDILDRQIQAVTLDDLHELQAPTACTQRKLVETFAPNGYSRGKAVVVRHGKLHNRPHGAGSQIDSSGFAGCVVFVCHEFYAGIALKSSTSLVLGHLLSDGKVLRPLPQIM